MIRIYHNPRCSKSRQALELLREKGIQPEIVLYLDNPPDRVALAQILDKLGMRARQLLRTGESEYRENNLGSTELTEEQLIAVMVEHPRLIERPIVVNGNRAALGRPPENVLSVLD